ncbi:hypothetical protein [Streptantibioticus ferralitis]|uniref:Uncharacterized protein n=1 Tax=Streptantibioticus ferralitis TaxID=236510 RepID=A0ABT5YTL0_9ACTN|nr:hypothetical protein [Streptantibioticus ferralitis]MDF2254793.1 hypothetical protein [Streptantibioticus ferralitis]
MFAWDEMGRRGAMTGGGVRWVAPCSPHRWGVGRLVAVAVGLLLGGALVVAGGGVGYAMSWPGAPGSGTGGAAMSGWGVRPPPVPGLPGFGRSAFRHSWSPTAPGLGRPLRCPHGLGRAMALPALGPRACESSVRAAACGPLRSVDVSGSIATVRNSDSAPVLRRLTGMADRSCGVPEQRMPDPPSQDQPRQDPPRRDPPAAQPSNPPSPPPVSGPPPGIAHAAPSPRVVVPHPVVFPRRAPRAAVAAPAGLSTAGALFLVLLPAVVAGVAAGARSASRAR